MNVFNEISHVYGNIFISGIIPLGSTPEKIGQYGITFVVSCVPLDYSKEVHQRLLNMYDDIVILYLPYYDNVKQNLWQVNDADISIVKKISNKQEYDYITNLINIYDKKPLIEIGYHFMNMATEHHKNILVHCMAGMSRSSSVIIYYMMKKHGLSYADAEGILIQSRSIVKPNDSFRAQLIGYRKKRDQFTPKDAEDITKMHINFVII